MSSTRAILIIALALPFAACDSGTAGPEMASVTVRLAEVSAGGDCDSATNPGDYQFSVEILDEGNQILETMDLPVGATYRTHAEGTFISLNDGDSEVLNQTISFERPREEGGGFALRFSATEWDSPTQIDADMDDVSTVRTHSFRDGVFVGILGSPNAQAYGSQRCNVRLDYSVAVQ